MCHFVGNFFFFHHQMKLISWLFTCSLKKFIHSLRSSTLFTPAAASRRHSYKCGVLPAGGETGGDTAGRGSRAPAHPQRVRPQTDGGQQPRGAAAQEGHEQDTGRREDTGAGHTGRHQAPDPARRTQERVRGRPADRTGSELRTVAHDYHHLLYLPDKVTWNWLRMEHDSPFIIRSKII